jgi:hypothetical protein
MMMLCHVASAVGGGLVGDSGHGAAHVKHRRVRPRRARGVRVIGDDGDGVVGQAGEVGGLPVVVPPMEDGVVESALERGIRGRRQQVYERCSKPAEIPYHPLALFDGAGVAASDGESRPPRG